MLASLPEETTQLFIDLCTTTGPLTIDIEETPSTAAKQPSNTGPSYLSYLALNRTSIAAPTISSDTATAPSPSIKTVRPGDTASHRDSIHDVSRPPTPPPPTSSAIVTARPPKPPTAKRLSPQLYFAHFVDHMDQFVVFLETVALRRWGQSVDEKVALPAALSPSDPPADEQADKRDQVAVWNTLLELYLNLPGPGNGINRDKSSQSETAFREKAQRLLQSQTIPYDPTHALILCSSCGYTRGLVLLWEKMGMYEDVLRFWMDRDKEGTTPEASAQVVHHLKLYGAEHPHLYPLVLRFLTSTPDLLRRHQEDVKEVLDHIDKEGIVPPLGVIQVLSRNGVASVGLVKDWLITRIKEARNEIQSVSRSVSGFRAPEADFWGAYRTRNGPTPIEWRPRLNCGRWRNSLILNILEYFTLHGALLVVDSWIFQVFTSCVVIVIINGMLSVALPYRLRNRLNCDCRCLADHESECPNCAREHGVIREIRRNNERLADQHDLFLSEVQDGGFGAVAAAFSRGVLNMSRLEVVHSGVS